jgi:uncharacterized membrane protein (DUF2068 family)
MPHVIQDASHRGEASLQEQKPPSHIAGLRTVALFEALKGVLAVFLGYGLFSLAHQDVGEFAVRLIRHLHLNPDRHISQALIHTADKVTQGKIVALALAALAYATVRFIEAYGLWHVREWAQWFALLSGCLYLPWEIYELLRKSTPIRWSLFLINVGIVLYMAYLQIEVTRKSKVEAEDRGAG